MKSHTIPRDRWDRPLVVPPEGGRRKPYTRVTRFVSCLEDTYKLGAWQQRMTAIGLADRPDLLLAVSAHREDRDTMDRLTSQAREAATAGAAATTGTAIHSLTERVDRGEALPASLPEQYRRDLDAYRAAMQAARLTIEGIEQFHVHDKLQAAGTPDRIVTRGGRRYIADVKTGSVEYGIGKIAMQLSLYSRSLAYDTETDERSPNNVDQANGILIHLPAGQGTCALWWLDLNKGWAGVQLATDVRAWRKLKFKDLTAPLAA